MTAQERRRKAHNLGGLLAGALAALMAVQLMRFAEDAPTGVLIVVAVSGALWIADTVRTYVDRRLMRL
jgi:hypothetical protein